MHEAFGTCHPEREMERSLPSSGSSGVLNGVFKWGRLNAEDFRNLLRTEGKGEVD